MKLVLTYDNLVFDENSNLEIVSNNDNVNLNEWYFEITLSLSDISNGCFIFDKRNGQWHRNYCFGFITEEWFKHHSASVRPGKYFFLDLGDGSRIESELDNGVCVAVHDIEPNRLVRLTGSYSKKLELSQNNNISYKNLNLNSVKGDGNLVIGSMGEPHTGAFPQYGLGKFKGTIKTFRLFKIGE